MILLYGMGQSNLSVKKYLDKTKQSYETEDSGIIYQYIIKSPGIRKEDVRARGKIISDAEFFYLEFKPEMVAITGTNGKTTTTLLTTHLLKNRHDVVYGGNIGVPFFDITSLSEIKILELSSFMLDTVDTFKPKIALILNITSAHLDYHKTMDNYKKAKLNLIKNLAVTDFLIINKDDVNLEKIESKATIYTFSLKNKGASIFYENGFIYYKDNKIEVSDTFSQKETDIYNMMAAITVAVIYNVSFKEIKAGLKTFKKPPYRMEEIYTDIYNDAKSTNINSTYMNIKDLKEVRLIAGGYDRGEALEDISKIIPNLKEVFLYGANRFRLASYFKDIKVTIYETLEEVMANLDLKGLIVYSPLAPSYDQFKSFEERGQLFTNLVKKSLENSL